MRIHANLMMEKLIFTKNEVHHVVVQDRIILSTNHQTIDHRCMHFMLNIYIGLAKPRS